MLFWNQSWKTLNLYTTEVKIFEISETVGAVQLSLVYELFKVGFYKFLQYNLL